MTMPVSQGQFGPTQIPRLETQRLRLRAHSVSDLIPLTSMWANPANTRFIGNKTRNRTEVWKQIQQMIGSWALLGYGFWLVEDKRTGEFLGEAGFLEALRDVSPPYHGTPEIGWVFDQPHWGNGYASEALDAMLAWADKTLPDPRTVCIIEPDHAASVRVATKAGFSRAYETSLDGDAIIVFERSRRTDAIN